MYVRYGLIVVLLPICFLSNAMHNVQELVPLVTPLQGAHAQPSAVRMLLADLEALDKPERELLCGCMPWRKHDAVTAVARQLSTKNLSFDERAWVEAYIEKTSSCICSSHPPFLVRNGACCLAMLASLAGGLVASHAHECHTQNSDPENFCRTHPQVFECPYSCNEQQLYTGAYVGWGVAACATCVCFTLCSSCGDSPTLTQMLAAPQPYLALRYDTGIAGLPAVYPVLEKVEKRDDDTQDENRFWES